MDSGLPVSHSAYPRADIGAHQAMGPGVLSADIPGLPEGASKDSPLSSLWNRKVAGPANYRSSPHPPTPLPIPILCRSRCVSFHAGLHDRKRCHRHHFRRLYCIRGHHSTAGVIRGVPLQNASFQLHAHHYTFMQNSVLLADGQPAH